MPRIAFSNGQSVEVEAGKNLSVALDVLNSPVLFGCRTGICATCLVQVLEGWEHLPPQTEDEAEVVELYSELPHCRLACQLRLKEDVTLAYLGNK